jgi:hypothetical protein
MAKRGGAVHVTTHRRHYVDKSGEEKTYETHLLRRSYREGGKAKNETVANLSHLPGQVIDVIRRSLAGETLVPADRAATVTRSVPHGARRRGVGSGGRARAAGTAGTSGPAA